MVMERPVSFHIGDEKYAFFWPTLGKVLLVSRLLAESGVCSLEVDGVSTDDIVRLCRFRREIAGRILAYNTLSSKKDVLDVDKVSSIQKSILDGLSPEDMARALSVALSMYGTTRFRKYYRLDKDAQLRGRIIAMKRKKGNEVYFGGRSIYGALIDPLCQRYGWTMDYVVWGISYQNIQMLLSDAQTSVYLSKEDRKRVHIPSDNIIDANDPANMEMIKKMFNE